MANVVLIDPKCKQLIAGWDAPIGLLKIARYLDDHGHRVRVFQDSMMEQEEMVAEASAADVVGISAISMQWPRAQELARDIRSRNGAKLVLGGPHATAIAPSLYNDTNGRAPEPFDGLIYGPGEMGMEMLASDSGNFDTPGFIFDGHSAALAEYVPVDFGYIQRFSPWVVGGIPGCGFLTSEGCFGKCKFCAGARACQGKWREYPIEAVVCNMVEVAEKYGFKAFRIWDDLFTLKSKRVREFCKLVRHKGWTLSGMSRADCVREDDMKAMRDAGFTEFALGVESGSEEVLKLAGKDVSVDRVRRAAKTILDNGITLETLFVVGLPGATLETSKQSLRLAKELGGKSFAQFFKPYPGTDFYDEIKAGQHGRLLDETISDYSRETPVFLPSGMTLEELNAVYGEWTRIMNANETDSCASEPPPSIPVIKERNVSTRRMAIRNTRTGTMPTIVHANGIRQGMLWKFILNQWRQASHFPVPSGKWTDELTIVTWNTEAEISPLEESIIDLHNDGVKAYSLGKNLKQWDRHQIKLTHEVMESIKTPYFFGMDAFDAILLDSPERLLRVFKSSFEPNGIKLVYGAELNYWPPTAKTQEEEEKRGGNKPYRYLNSGAFIGRTDFVKAFYARAMEVMKTYEPHWANDEQGIIKRTALLDEFKDQVTLDYDCQMFQNLFGIEQDELEMFWFEESVGLNIR